MNWSGRENAKAIRSALRNIAGSRFCRAVVRRRPSGGAEFQRVGMAAALRKGVRKVGRLAEAELYGNLGCHVFQKTLSHKDIKKIQNLHILFLNF